MAGPYAIIGLCGDSNAQEGLYGLNDGTDLAGSGISAVRSCWAGDGTFNSLTATIGLADEPCGLYGKGYSGATLASGTGEIGSTVALARLLRDRGKVPPGYTVLIVNGAHSGTAFLNYWATTGNRAAIDPFIDALQWALTQGDSPGSNMIWFYDWNHGANDGGQTQTQYQNNMVATWGEIRSTVGTPYTPIIAPSIPPNRYNPALGAQTNLGGVVAAQQNIAGILDAAAYVDCEDLTAIDSSNGYVHFPAASHRGGANNAPGNASEVVTNPISERKYTALLNLGWKMRASWT